MPKLPPPSPSLPLYFVPSEIFLYFLCNWQSGREQQRKSICLQSLNVIALHVCTLSPTLLGSSTWRSLLSAYCSLRIWFSGSWSLDVISFIPSLKENFKGILFTQELRRWIFWTNAFWPNILMKRKGQLMVSVPFPIPLVFWSLGSRGRWESSLTPIPSKPPPIPLCSCFFSSVMLKPRPPRFESPHKICKWTPNEIPFSSVSPSLKAFHQFSEPPTPNTNHLCM